MKSIDAIKNEDQYLNHPKFYRIGNSEFFFDVWYRVDDPEKQQSTKRLDNFVTDTHHNFESNNLADYQREKFTKIKLIENVHSHREWVTGETLYDYKISSFIAEREFGVDYVYYQKNMKSLKEVDYKRVYEWIATLLREAGAKLDHEKALDMLKANNEKRKALLVEFDTLVEIVKNDLEKLSGKQIELNGGRICLALKVKALFLNMKRQILKLLRRS